MPSAQKPAGAEDAERALSRDQPSAAAAAVPTPANNGSASADGAEVISKEHQQNPLGNDDLLPMAGGRIPTLIHFHQSHKAVHRSKHRLESNATQIAPFHQQRNTGGVAPLPSSVHALAP